MNLDNPPPSFTPHTAIIAWLAAGGDFLVNGLSFGAAMEPINKAALPNGKLGFEAHVQLSGDAWAKCAVILESESAVGETVYWAGHGHSGTSKPLIPRQRITVTGADGVPFVTLDDPGDDIQPMLHTQAVPTIAGTYNFETKVFVAHRHPKPLVPTDYAPVYGPSTGGKWPYMGTHHDVGRNTLAYWREQLAAFGNYPGHMLNPDGNFVHHSQFPKAVLAGGNYWHRDAPAYVRYTNPRDPSADKAHRNMAPGGEGKWTSFDGQHLAFDALCEAFIYFAKLAAEGKGSYPWDLRWLVLSNAHKFTFQFPEEDHDTFRWRPGTGRARGRILKSGTKLVRATRTMGDQDEIARNVELWVWGRYENQVEEWGGKLRRGQDPRLLWGKSNERLGFSPSEEGIQWWGFDEMRRYLLERGKPVPVELLYMMRQLSRWCFDAFTEVPMSRMLDWRVPLAIFPDGTVDKYTSGHFAFAAAVDVEVESIEDEAKLEALVEWGKGLDARWHAVVDDEGAV